MAQFPAIGNTRDGWKKKLFINYQDSTSKGVCLKIFKFQISNFKYPELLINYQKMANSINQRISKEERREFF